MIVGSIDLVNEANVFKGTFPFFDKIRVDNIFLIELF